MDTDRLVPLLAALQDDSRDIRLQASLAVLRLRDPALVPALLAALDIPERRIQGLVATVLGTLEDRRAVLPLIDLLRRAQSGSVEETVMDSFANVHAQAAEALGRLGDRQAMDPLIEALADEDAWTRGKDTAKYEVSSSVCRHTLAEGSPRRSLKCLDHQLGDLVMAAKMGGQRQDYATLCVAMVTYNGCSRKPRRSLDHQIV